MNYYDDAIASDDFEHIGRDFEADTKTVTISTIGSAIVRIMRQQALVDLQYLGWRPTARILTEKQVST